MMISPTAISPHNRRGGINWSSYWTQRSLFFLDGSIVDVAGTKYFVDKSANGRNFLITDYDFDTAWVSGFPYKSAATISAPAGDAVLIAADINNFLYDAGGTPNAIPVVSLFQNIDYLNTIYCKHEAQVVDGNGVETYEPRVSQVFMTAAALSAEDLVKANTYFAVPTIQAANTREVGTGKTYSTIEAAVAAATAGDRIYHYTGIYNRAATYYGYNKSLKFHGLSRVEATQGTTTTVFYATNCSSEFRHMIINCETKTTNAIANESAGADSLYDTDLYNCLFANINTRIILGNRGYDWTVKDSVLVKASSFIFGFYVGDLQGNLIKNALITCYLGLVAKHNKYTSDIMANHVAFTLAGGSHDIEDNRFTFTGVGLYNTGAITNSLAIKILRNIFSLKNNNTNSVISAINLRGNFTNGELIEIKNNVISDADALTSTGAKICIGLLNNASDIENNIINTTHSDITIKHIAVEFGASDNDVTCNIKNNVVRSAFTGVSSISVTIGAEGAYNVAHSDSVIEANSIINTGYSTGLHSLLINCGINAYIRYNFIKGGYYGIVVKTGTTAKAYTAGGIYGNLIINCSQGMRLRGVGGINVFNNTIVNSNVAGIYIDENAVVAGDQFSEDVIWKNNIILNSGESGYLVQMDQHAADNGCTGDYNIYYSILDNPFIIGATEYSWSEWQALGHDAHSVMLSEAQYNALFTDAAHEDFSLAVGSVAIGAGEAQAAAYDDGLDASTDWGSDTEVPVVVTRQQVAAWDCGAYVS